MTNEPAQLAELAQDVEAPEFPAQVVDVQAHAANTDAVGLPLIEVMAHQPFRFLTDHNVPVSVGNALSQMGHDVVRVSAIMPADSTDPVVARAAIEDSRILISWDRDFNAQRLASPRFAALTRIMMSGPEPEGASRLVSVFDVIEFALRRNPGMPVILRIGVGRVQIHV